MHPADELHAIRHQIRALRAREAALRETLISGDREGTAWRARVVCRRPRRIDAARLPAVARDDPRAALEAQALAVTLAPRAPGGG